METGTSTIAVTATAGVIDTSTPLGSYVHQITKGNIIQASLTAGVSFTGSNAALPSGSQTLTFSAEGQKL